MHPKNKTNNINWQNALNMANSAKRCGAKTRSTYPCKSPAMPNGRCRMHGGKSTGAPCGKAHGSYKHGRYTNNAKQRRKEIYELMQEFKFFYSITKEASVSTYLEEIGIAVDEIKTISDIKDAHTKVWEAICNQELALEEAKMISTYLSKQRNCLVKGYINQLVQTVKKKTTC